MSVLMRDPHVSFGRFKVLPRTDGKYIVFDPARPLAKGTVDTATSLAEATVACERASREATARGEENEPKRDGYKNDWGDPATWERMADVPPRPLFPSLLEGRDGHGTTNRNDEQRDGTGERREPGRRPGLELELLDEQGAQAPARGSHRQGRASKVRARPRQDGERP